MHRSGMQKDYTRNKLGVAALAACVLLSVVVRAEPQQNAPDGG
jgi:hypothetical protein